MGYKQYNATRRFCILSITFEKITQRYLKLTAQEPHLPQSIIEDVVLQRKALNDLGKDEVWLHQQLQEKGFPYIKGVVYTEVNEQARFMLLPYVERRHK